MAKKWISCISCDFQSECIACKVRLENYDKSSLASEDVGCFNHEMIKKQRSNAIQQLQLFKM